jgi:hypothetical protein
MLPQPDSKDPHQENLLDQTVWLSKCISLFREKLDLLEVKGTVSTQDSFAESLRQLRIEFRMFVTSPDARRLADLIENEISAEEVGTAVRGVCLRLFVVCFFFKKKYLYVLVSFYGLIVIPLYLCYYFFQCNACVSFRILWSLLAGRVGA